MKIASGRPLSKAIALGMALLREPGPIHLRKDFGAKPRRKRRAPQWAERASYHHVRTSRDMACDLHAYLISSTTPDLIAIKEATSEIRRNLCDARRQLTAMKAEFASDPGMLAAINSREQQLTLIVRRLADFCDCQESSCPTKLVEGCDELVSQLDMTLAHLCGMARKLAQRDRETSM